MLGQIWLRGRPAIPMENGKIGDYQNSATPEPIVTKLGMGDYLFNQ